MSTNFIATAPSQTFTNTHHTVNLQYLGGSLIAYEFTGGGVDILVGSGPDPRDPYNGSVEGYGFPNNTSVEPDASFFNIISNVNPPPGGFFYFEVFADNSVDYHLSPSAVFVDLKLPTQQGGFAQGDVLNNISEITGSFFDDVIRGSNVTDFPPDSLHPAQNFYTFTINNPGNNVLNGGNGDDVLEGHGGADVLNGGLGFDIASYKSSPAAVTVRLPDDTQTAIATGGDATDDTFSSIEGLVGSRFNDTLTGNSLNNVLAGGLGNDVLNGKGGIDRADYSRDHFFDGSLLHFDTADQVVVNLGLNDASGTGIEFARVVDFQTLQVSFVQESVDTLISIEDVTGTSGNDTLVGNEKDNVLDGRAGNDSLDGGFGNDTLIGGPGNNTATFFSHNLPSGTQQPIGEQFLIALGLNGAAGHATRSEPVFGIHISFQVVESDTLSSIQNVDASNRSETIIGNEQGNVLDAGAATTRSMAAAATIRCSAVRAMTPTISGALRSSATTASRM